MRVEKTRRIIMTMVMTLILMMSSVVCFAEPGDASVAGTNSAVVDARGGVVRVGVYHQDRETGSYTLLQSGSGFLIGTGDSAGVTTLITNYHVVHLTQEDLEAAKTYLHADSLNLVYRVAVKRDTCVDAVILNESEGSDFAVLSLNSPIYDKEPLKFAPEGSTKSTQTVYALGFPGVLTYIQDDNTYTEDDVNVTKGTISKLTKLESRSYVQHDATLSEGNSGGPLVDETGSIVGINVSGMSENNVYYSLSSEEITEVLTTLGIDYVVYSGTQTTSEEPQGSETPEEIDYSKLQDVIDAFDDVDKKEYTSESYEDYKDAVDAGRDIMDNADSQSEVNSAVSEIKTAAASLVTDKTEPGDDATGISTTTIIIIGAAVVVVLVVIIIIVVVSGRKKKSTPPSPEPSRGGYDPFRGGQSGATGSDPTTSVLDGGAAPTTMLNGGQGGASAMLFRLKTGENATVSRPVFGIGKDQRQVEFCVTNNTSISRRHAEIRQKNGAFYLVDLNSTNGTFLNGQKLSPNQEMILKSGDRIKLSDEEFQFKM